MADVKIGITANADKAIKQIEELNKALYNSGESLSQLQKRNARYANGKSTAEQLLGDSNAWNDIQKSIEKQIWTFKAFRGEVKGTADAEKWLTSYGEKLSMQGSLTSDQIAEITTRIDSLRQENSKLGTVTEKTTGKFSKFSDKLFEIGKNILVFQTAIAVFRKTLTAIKTAISDSIKAASTAEQVFSKLNTVYSGFSTSASKASEELSKSLGVATSTASSALSTIGDLLQAQGMSVSESLSTASEWATQLQDIIAFKDLNMTLEEFADSFMSGAAGNLRNFRTFGSIVKESAVEARLAKEGYDNLTESEQNLKKMVTRATMALEQQANAIGATNREWETTLSINRRLEEAQKSLQETMGKSINTVLDPIKKSWIDIIKNTNEAIAKYNEYSALLNKDKTTNVDNNSKDLSFLDFAKTSYGSFFRTFLENRNAKSSKNQTEEEKKLLSDNSNFVDVIKYFKTRLFSETSDKEINAAIEAYQLSVDQAIQIMDLYGMKYSESTEKFLRTQEELRLSMEKTTTQNDADYAQLDSAANSLDKFIESLASINGVDIGNYEYGFGLENLAANGMTEKELGRMSDIRTWVMEDVVASFEKPIEEFGDAWDMALKGIDQKDLIQKKMASIESAYQALYNTADYETLKTLEGFYATLQDSLDSLSEDAEAETEKTRNALWNGLEQVSGVFGGLINAAVERANLYETARAEGKEGADLKDAVNNSGSWISAVIQIAASLDTFSPIFEDVDRYLNAIDAFLAPLSPAIELLSDILYNAFIDLMPILFPLIKIIASAVTIVATVIDFIRITIKNIFTLVHNILEYIKHPTSARKRDIWEYESYKDSWDKMNATLEKIAGMTFEIKENTEDKDTSAYDEMYRRGLINLSEYNALLADAYNRKWDTVNSFASGSYHNGTGGTTVVYSGAITITIDGTNLSAKQIADELERRSIAGNQTYA